MQTLAAMIMILGYSIIAVPTGIVTVELTRAAEQHTDIGICCNCQTACMMGMLRITSMRHKISLTCAEIRKTIGGNPTRLTKLSGIDKRQQVIEQT